MILVYKYGCLPPESLPEEAVEQLRLANRFWNALVEIDRDTQTRLQELWNQQEPIRLLETQKERLLKETEELRGLTKQEKQRTRSQKVSAAHKEQIANLRGELRTVNQNIKETKTAMRDSLKEQQNVIWQQQKEAIKAARQDFSNQGLYWGHYNAVARNFQAAGNLVRKEGGQLRFHRFDGEGTWTVQIQTVTPNPDKGRKGTEPATMKDLFDPQSRIRNVVQVNSVNFTDWDKLPRNERRKKARTVLRIRVGSTEKQEPIWVELPMIMHRPMPENAQIKQVELTRRKLGRKYDYSVSFTVGIPEEPMYQPPAMLNAVAIHLGWRRQGDSLRAGMWMDENGKQGEVLLPNRLIGGFDQADRIKSHRDQLFNETIETLWGWINQCSNCPDWLNEQTTHMKQWRSHGRLVHLISIWQDNRFDSDSVIWGVLEKYLHRERHLEDFEVNLRDRLVRSRKEIYRVTAARLAEQYATLIVEDMDLKQMSRRPTPEIEESRQATKARANRQLVSPGVFRAALVAAFKARGREVIVASSKNITRVHADCGTLVSQDYAADIKVYCPNCDMWYDQDVNACKNLLGQDSSIPERQFS